MCVVELSSSNKLVHISVYRCFDSAKIVVVQQNTEYFLWIVEKNLKVAYVKTF